MPLIFLCLMALELFAQPWVMFNDLDDTYLYDQASGQVYIRVKKGGKNYEDQFVKMGVIDTKAPNVKKDSPPKVLESKTPAQEQAELLKKAQELQQDLQKSIFQNTP